MGSSRRGVHCDAFSLIGSSGCWSTCKINARDHCWIYPGASHESVCDSANTTRKVWRHGHVRLGQRAKTVCFEQTWPGRVAIAIVPRPRARCPRQRAGSALSLERHGLNTARPPPLVSGVRADYANLEGTHRPVSQQVVNRDVEAKPRRKSSEEETSARRPVDICRPADKSLLSDEENSSASGPEMILSVYRNPLLPRFAGPTRRLFTLSFVKVMCPLSPP